MKELKGKHAIFEAIQANSPIERLVVDFKVKYKEDVRRIISLARKKSIKIQIISSEDFNKTTKEQNTQGLLAYISSEKLLEIKDIIENKSKYPLIIAVDHIEDPFNFGAIIRTSEIFGAKAVIFPKDRNCQITSGVIKASSGAVNHIDMVRVVNIAQALQELRKARYWIYGADANIGTNLNDFSPAFPLVLVVGNEHKGLSKRVSKMLNMKIKIPSAGKTSSLNVSVATGVIMYYLYGNAVDHGIF